MAGTVSKVCSVVLHRGFISSISFARSCKRTAAARASMSTEKKGNGNMVVPKDEVVRFIRDCMAKVGARIDDAQVVAHHLMTADYRGHFSHGMNRVQMYVDDITKKKTNPLSKPKIITDFQAIATVDGMNGLGQVIGKYCMELAMEKATKYGIGMVVTRGSNHYGICGYYTLMAIEREMIGFSCTNTSPLMAPTRSKIAALGTNPISVGMGAQNGDQFVLDMATTTVALGKIELAERKKENIPEGWALNENGQMTNNAKEAAEASLLMPLGGEERNSGYKGYGLATMVELFCGVLSGSRFGTDIRNWKSDEGNANLGQCFMAIDPQAFGSGSDERLQRLIDQLRGLPSTRSDKPVFIAGDPERMAMDKVDKDGGLTYHQNQLESTREFALTLGVQPMNLIPINNYD